MRLFHTYTKTQKEICVYIYAIFLQTLLDIVDDVVGTRLNNAKQSLRGGVEQEEGFLDEPSASIRLVLWFGGPWKSICSSVGLVG